MSTTTQAARSDREFLRRMSPYVGETPEAARDRHRREDQDIDTLACGCPTDTPVRQVDEHNVQCTGCGLVSA